MRLLIFISLFIFCMPALSQRYPPSGGGGGCSIYTTSGNLPGSAIDGTCAVTLDTYTMWVFDINTTTWLAIGAGGTTVTSIAAFGSSPNASGGSISSNVLTLQPADGTHPGGVSTGSQTFGGTKTIATLNLTNPLGVAYGGLGVSLSGTGGTSQVLKQTTVGANVSVAQLACSDLSNSVASCSIDTTNASNISSGTLPAARLPTPSATTLGGIESLAATTHQWINTISTGGVPSSTQPACSDLSNSSASCSTDATNASNISSGTLALARGGAGTSLAGTGGTSQVLKQVTVGATITVGQLACTDLSGVAASCATDATNASNISSGTLSNSRLSAVPNSVLATMSNNTVKSNISGSSAVPADNTVTAILDSALGSAQGDVLYRNASNWVVLAPGTSGFVLSSGGASGNPSWVSTLTNPMSTGGDIIYGGSSGTPTRLANGNSGQVLESAGGTSAPAWTTLTVPSVTKFTSTSTTAGYWFTISSGNATTAATYTNNGNTYTVIATVASSTNVFMSGVSAPLASGTLTRASGSGDATLTFSKATAMASFTPTSGAAIMQVVLVGDGGGGGGIGNASSNCGASGGGGGGAAVVDFPTTGLAGTWYYSIGAGGAGGTAGANAGTAGTGSAIANATYGWAVAGGGGAGGAATSAACASITYFANGVAGGTAATNASPLTFQGGPGLMGWTLGTPGAIAGAGGASAFGIGQMTLAPQSGGAVGNNGNNYGSGGSGALNASSSSTNRAGGNGAAGLLIVKTWNQ